MGKRMRKKDVGLSLRNDHAGCTWGILHMIKYNKWGHVKKRLSYRKLGTGRDDSGAKIPGNGHYSGNKKKKEQDNAKGRNSNVGKKAKPSTSVAKHSVITRIRSLIPGEIYGKKSLRKRSSTYIHTKLGHSDIYPLAELVLSHETPGTIFEINENYLAAKPMYFEETSSNDESWEERQTIYAGDYLECDQVLKHQPVEDNTLLEEKLSNAKQYMLEKGFKNAKVLMRDPLAHHCNVKDFLDALDIININNNLLLRLMPGSYSYLFYDLAFGEKLGLTRSCLVPLPGSSSGRRALEPSQCIRKLACDGLQAKWQIQLLISSIKEKSSQSESLEDCSRRSMSLSSRCKTDTMQGMSRRVYNTSGSSLGQNHTVINQFKNLNKKVKHVIKENRKERDHITKDAIIHKIPHGQRFSEDLKKGFLNKLRDPAMFREGEDGPVSGYDSDFSSHSLGKGQLRHTRRSASLTESLERYCQLYETSFNKEDKFSSSESFKLKTEAGLLSRSPISLKRVLSLPNLNSYLYLSEEASDALSPRVSTETAKDGSVNICNIDEQRNLGLLAESQCEQQSDTPLDITNQQSSLNISNNDYIIRDMGPIFDAYKNVKNGADLKIDDLGNLTRRENASCNEQNVEILKEFQAAAAETSFLSSCQSDFLNDKASLNKPSKFLPKDSEIGTTLLEVEGSLGSSKGAENVEDAQKVEILGEHCIPHLQVDMEDQVQFNYVREVLELSGFSNKGSLGTWHSDERPLAPSLYKEMEGCQLPNEPECPGDVEGGYCNYLLLFDLINDVLLEIYGRPYSYFPKPLSSLSRVRPVPGGNQVLHQVWALITWYMSSASKVDPSLDYAVSRDLAKYDGWMNLQFDTECAGFEIEELIFDDLLEEIIWT